MGGKSSSNSSEQVRADEMKRQAEIRRGTERVNGIFDNNFTPDFFKEQRDNYLNYAKPQLNDQYGDAQKELTFALARAGSLDSSSRASKSSDLTKLYDLNSQQIGDQAMSFANTARGSVEDARSGLISTLNATGDAQGAANSAIARSTALSQPQAYSPLTQLFTDFTAGLGAQSALEKANYYSGGQTPVRYKTGLFTPGTNSVQVT